MKAIVAAILVATSSVAMAESLRENTFKFCSKMTETTVNMATAVVNGRSDIVFESIDEAKVDGLVRDMTFLMLEEAVKWPTKEIRRTFVFNKCMVAYPEALAERHRQKQAEKVEF